MKYRYKEVKDINPNSPTYNTVKWVRDPDNDDICNQPVVELIKTDVSNINFSCISKEDIKNNNTVEGLEKFIEVNTHTINIIDDYDGELELISKPDWLQVSPVVNKKFTVILSKLSLIQE